MTVTAPDWNRARRLAHASGHPLPSERVPLRAASGRILASDLRALCALPPRDTSAMDGWAVSGPGPWSVIADQRAGSLPTVDLADGQAVTITTGAIIPKGTTGIVRSEHGSIVATGRLEAQQAPTMDVRRAGEEAAPGSVLAPAGTRLRPAHVGLAAATGHDELEVVRRPRARYLVLGDELLTTGLPCAGMVRDSLGPQVPSWLEAMGVEVVDVTWVEDTLDAHLSALASCTDVDLVVTSGGTARGPFDYLRAAVEKTGGELIVDTVAVRPGHPMAFAAWDASRWMIGLPGNPQAAIAALLTFGLPLIAALHGQALPALGERRITEYAASRGNATRLVLCTSAADECVPTAYIGSGMLRGLAAADGFAVIPPSGATIGDRVAWLPLPT